MIIKYTKDSLEDVRGIKQHLRTKNKTALKRILDYIYKAVDLFIDFPEMGHKGRVGGTREINIKSTPYFVIYNIIGDIVYVIRIMHDSQQWPPSADNEKTILELLQ